MKPVLPTHRWSSSVKGAVWSGAVSLRSNLVSELQRCFYHHVLNVLHSLNMLSALFNK